MRYRQSWNCACGCHCDIFEWTISLGCPVCGKTAPFGRLERLKHRICNRVHKIEKSIENLVNRRPEGK